LGPRCVPAPAWWWKHLPGRLIAPGFVDLHLHYPANQCDRLASRRPVAWLENYTFS